MRYGDDDAVVLVRANLRGPWAKTGENRQGLPRQPIWIMVGSTDGPTSRSHNTDIGGVV
jgi:hypothetical protein